MMDTMEDIRPIVIVDNIPSDGLYIVHRDWLFRRNDTTYTWFPVKPDNQAHSEQYGKTAVSVPFKPPEISDPNPFAKKEVFITGVKY